MYFVAGKDKKPFAAVDIKKQSIFILPPFLPPPALVFVAL